MRDWEIPYSPLLVIQAEGLLLKDADKLKNSEPYRFDVIDVQRQMMTIWDKLSIKELPKLS